MPGRNEPCPCGSGIKHKRCCLRRNELVTRELRERDAVIENILDWVQDEHADVIAETRPHTQLVRILGGEAGRSLSVHWAIGDYRPSDGGPPLLERYAARPDLDERTREIARGLAVACLDVHRVVEIRPDFLALETLRTGTRVELFAERRATALERGELLVARIATTTTFPALLGMARRHEADCQRRWLARLATLPEDPADAALAVLHFIAEDAAEPLPEDVELHTAKLAIDDPEAVLDDLGDDESFTDIGLAFPEGYAYAWPVMSDAGVTDLGGLAESGETEGARLVVTDETITVLSACPVTLKQAIAQLGTLAALELPGLPRAA